MDSLSYNLFNMQGPLLSLINGIGSGDSLTVLVYLSVIIVMLLFAFPFHELAHAVVADRLGDDTPRMAGRITLNPLKHLDPWGSLLFLLAGFGWATTPISPWKLRSVNGSYRNSWALVALAGPIANLILALVFGILFRILNLIHEADPSSMLMVIVLNFLRIAVYLNITLALFNIIPVPPLDGFTVLSAFLPSQYENVLMQVRQYGFLILVALSFTGIFNVLIIGPARQLTRLLLGVGV
jgi:Zn-dependent protease